MKGDDPELTKRRNQRQQKQAAESAVAHSIADRLTHRAQQQTAIITLSDEAGDIDIEMQIPSWGATCDLTQIESMMTDQAGRNKLATIMDTLSLDESLDHEFWLTGSIGLVDMRLIIEGLTNAASKRIKEVQSFRSK